jgi:hypothetical protein
MSLQRDTRQLLRTGSAIFFTGIIALVLMFTFFGGVSVHGPHTNGGWLSLIVAIGCLPLGLLTLLLAFAKVLGDRRK